MVWCQQATSHCLNQCWPRFMSLYRVTRPQWVEQINHQYTILWPEYSRIRSIPWVLTIWLLMSPGHQQPWHWLRGIMWSLVFYEDGFDLILSENFHPWCIHVWENKTMFYVPIMWSCLICPCPQLCLITNGILDIHKAVMHFQCL